MNIFRLALVLRFWVAFAAAVFFLAVSGWSFAQLLLPEPLKYYNTSYLTFAIPQDWHCARENTFFSCNRTEGGLNDATMILTAKLTGQQDSLAAYQAHLETPRPFTNQDGVAGFSVVEDVSRRYIDGFEWVVGQHLGSEITSYRTWYFATVTPQIAMLVTFSAHQSAATRYLGDVEVLLNSLELGRVDYR